MSKRDLLVELGYEDSIVFENPDYDNAIIGTDDNSRVVYDYDKMVECLMEEDRMDYEEAVEFIEYNTIRALPYYPNGPIVVHGIEIYDEYNKPFKMDTEEEIKRVSEDCINWIKSWFDENGNGCNAIVGVSGGKDSLIVAALCAKALGPERVIGISMPDKGQGTNEAEKICEYLGIKYYCIPIDGITGAMNFSLELTGDKVSKQTKQNISPRIRMSLLYGFAQSHNGRVVGTTNLDERLTGYFTKFGDGLASDLEPIELLTVGEIIKIGKYLNLPDKWLYKTPSADLPNTKTDEEELGFSYKDFDEYIRHTKELPKEIVDKIEKRINNNSYKLNPIAHYIP